MLDSRDMSSELAEGDEKKEYQLRKEKKLKEVLEELEKYNKIHDSYRKFMKEKITRVLKGKMEWDGYLKKDLFDNYNIMIEAREALNAKVGEYKKEEIKIEAIKMAS